MNKGLTTAGCYNRGNIQHTKRIIEGFITEGCYTRGVLQPRGVMTVGVYS